MAEKQSMTNLELVRSTLVHVEQLGIDGMTKDRVSGCTVRSARLLAARLVVMLEHSTTSLSCEFHAPAPVPRRLRGVS